MLVPQSWNSTARAAGRLFAMTRCALFVEYSSAQFQITRRGRLRNRYWRQIAQVRSDVDRGLGFKCGLSGKSPVHRCARAIVCGKPQYLLHQIFVPLSSEGGNRLEWISIAASPVATDTAVRIKRFALPCIALQ